MQFLLNRIEYDFVYENFIKDKPELMILNSSRVVKILANNYEIKNSFIIFDIPKNIKKSGMCQIIFEHKKRAMCFFSNIVCKNSVCELKFSESVFKYDFIEGKTEIYANFLLSTGTNIFVKELEKFPLDIFFNDLLSRNLNHKMLKNIKSMLLKQSTITNEIIFYRLQYFLMNYYNCERNNLILPHNLLLFIDDKIIIIFVKQITADLLISQNNFQIEVIFPERFILIDCDSVFGFMTLNNNNSILAISCEKAKMEDKRFLSERTYRLKYGDKNMDY